jgi:riboflavin biosynthesis pyrimidine reductase
MINLIAILEDLVKRGKISIYIEGGQELFSQFLSQNLFDEIIIFQHPVILGRGVASVLLDTEVQLRYHSIETIGVDVKFECINQKTRELLNKIT